MEYHAFPNLRPQRIRFTTCKRVHCDNPYYHLPNVELPFAFLKTCRQAYHEARNVFYKVNIFRIRNPSLGDLFIQRVSNYGLALRSVHLNICVPKRNDERKWDNTLHKLAENFKTVQNIYIDVREHPWDHSYYDTLRHNPAVGKKPFLKGLLELKKLPLKTFEISVYEPNPRSYHYRVDWDVYSWSPDQKRAWSRSIKSAILDKD